MKPFSFFGIFKVERNTDILALAAFVISSSTLFYQIGFFFTDAKINLVAPKQIRIYVNDSGFITLISSVAFTNRSPKDKNGVILDLTANFDFPQGNGRTLSWHKYATTLQRNNELIVNEISSSHPFVVEGGSSESREVWFMPRREYQDCGKDDSCINRNYITQAGFTESLNKALVQGSEFLLFKITFKASTLDKTVPPVSCIAYLDQKHGLSIELNRFAIASCVESA
jgi:hypothetical protein